MDRTGCTSVEWLDRFLAGDLPAEDTVRVSAHLEGCGRCQGAVDGLLADDSLLAWRRTVAARSEPGPPDAFLDSLRRMSVQVARASDSRASLFGEPADDGPRPELCQEWIGGYEVLVVLSRGGKSVVYKARQPGSSRVVPLTLLSPRSPNRPEVGPIWTLAELEIGAAEAIEADPGAEAALVLVVEILREAVGHAAG